MFGRKSFTAVLTAFRMKTRMKSRRIRMKTQKNLRKKRGRRRRRGLPFVFLRVLSSFPRKSS